jgi:hypothetical protein
MALALVSQGYSLLLGRFLCITHPFATNFRPKAKSVRLACVKHTASVRSEPGSNSQVLRNLIVTKSLEIIRLHRRDSCN